MSNFRSLSHVTDDMSSKSKGQSPLGRDKTRIRMADTDGGYGWRMRKWRMKDKTRMRNGG